MLYGQSCLEMFVLALLWGFCVYCFQGVFLECQLTFKDHFAKTAQSCRVALHNIRKIRPFLTVLAAELLFQALVISRLDYCNALLDGFQFMCNQSSTNDSQCSSSTGLQWPQNRAHVSPLFISLHCLQVADHIKSKTLMFVYRTATDSTFSLTSLHPSRSLWSVSGTITERHPELSSNKQ